MKNITEGTRELLNRMAEDTNVEFKVYKKVFTCRTMAKTAELFLNISPVSLYGYELEELQDLAEKMGATREDVAARYLEMK